MLKSTSILKQELLSSIFAFYRMKFKWYVTASYYNTDPGIIIVRKNAVCGIWRSISSTYQSKISSSFHMEIIFSSWCDLHICRFFCVSSTPCVCVRQNLVHEMAAKIWWRYLSKKLHWYCTDCKIQWQSVYTATILAWVSTLQMVACRALLYSTTTFYTIRVFFQIVFIS